MDVFNKFYSSVSSTVSQLSGVLPGNPVTREYEVLNVRGSAGVGLLWKVYDGFKKSTKQEVSIFVFEKKQIDRWSKEDKEKIIETLKRGVQQLTKIKHPHILTVQHPLEESRESLAFATEPVYSSLANVLKDNRSDKKLFDIEIKHGLLQLIEGLMFLHSDAKIIHRNLTPESIVINKQRSWKIFGFDYCIANQPKSDGSSFWPFVEFNSSFNMLTQPSLEYTAPEIILNSINTTECDIFSFGVLVYAIYSGGKPLKIVGNDYNSFRSFANELNRGVYPRFNSVPNDLADNLKELLHASPQFRPKLHAFSKITYFQDVGVKTLNYLDSLYQWDNFQKSKFYKGLPEIIPTLPHRVNLYCILPYLIQEFVNSPMVPFVLPNVLLIAEQSTQKEYVEYILPHLKPIMKLQEPIQILLILMQKMNLLLKLTPAEEVKLNVLPLLYRSLECDMPQIQELCLNILPTFSSLIDYNAMKNALLPRIKKLCLSSQNFGVKVNCLICIGKLLEHLDKWLVLDEVLPFLTQIQSREPAVIMGIIGVLKIALTNPKLGITKDVMSTKIIPFLMPLCIENGLNIAQFNSIVTLIKDMVNRVETEQREKLEQLKTVQKEARLVKAEDFLANELDNKNSTNSGSSLSQLPLDEVFNNNSNNTVPNVKKSEGLKLTTNENQSNVNSTKPDILSSLMNANIDKKKRFSNHNNESTKAWTNNQSNQLILENFAFNKSSNSVNMSSVNSLTGMNPAVNMSVTSWQSANPVKVSPKTDSLNNLKIINTSAIKPLLAQTVNSNSSYTSKDLLLPQNTADNCNTNLNALSQQDILNFLN